MRSLFAPVHLPHDYWRPAVPENKQIHRSLGGTERTYSTHFHPQSAGMVALELSFYLFIVSSPRDPENAFTLTCESVA